MKRLLMIAGVVAGLLVLLTATSFAARSPQATPPAGLPQNAATQAPEAGTTQLTPSAESGFFHRLGEWMRSMMAGAPAMRGMNGLAPRSALGGGMSGSGLRRGVGLTGAAVMTGTMGGYGIFGAGAMTGTLSAPGAMLGHGGLTAGATMHEDVETLLGMTHDDLYQQMATGKTLVQIATEKGLTEQQLVDGILAGRKTAMQQSVAGGWMTQQQADAMLADMALQVRTMVNSQDMNYGNATWSMMWSGGWPAAGNVNQHVSPGGAMAPGYGMGRGMHR